MDNVAWQLPGTAVTATPRKLATAMLGLVGLVRLKLIFIFPIYEHLALPNGRLVHVRF